MAGPGNQHCANCIGTLSFPMLTKQSKSVKSGGIRWHDFVRNYEVSLPLYALSDRITRGRNAIFGHVATLPDNITAH